MTGQLALGAPERLALPDAELRWWPDWLPQAATAAWFARLLDETRWEQSEITIAGRRLPVPRLNAWYGDVGAGYGYSGTRLVHHSWTPALAELRDRVQRVTDARFNSALLNCYRSGADSVDWHSDDEPELGPAPVIAALSLGVARRFELRHRERRGWRRHLDLGGGSLLLMNGAVQRHWQHRVPKQPGLSGIRISVTFRLVRDPAAWAAAVVDAGAGC